MVLTATNVRVGITGALRKGPPDAPPPSNAESALDSSYVDLGYVSEDGVSENWEDSVDDIIAWQNATTVRSATTESTLSIGLTLIETSGAVLQTFHRGSTVVEDPAGFFTLDVKPIVADPSRWVLDVIDGSRLIRVYLGNGEIVERGEIMYANGEPIGYPVTLRGYPDDDGNICRKFSNDIAWGTGLSAS
jgi:hypothetical protein